MLLRPVLKTTLIENLIETKISHTDTETERDKDGYWANGGAACECKRPWRH